MPNRRSTRKIVRSIGAFCLVSLALCLNAIPQSTKPSVTISTRLQTFAATNDLTGTIAITSGTSGSHTFSAAFNSAPVCVLTPTTDPMTSWWVVTTTSTVTAHIHTGSTIMFNYICVGNPS
jgi:hypothetical protein